MAEEKVVRRSEDTRNQDGQGGISELKELQRSRDLCRREEGNH